MTVTEERWTDEPLDPSAWWAKEAAELRRWPGRWRDVRYCSTYRSAVDMAQDIRDGNIAAFRPIGDYTAKARLGVVKAAYIGDQRDEYDEAVLSTEAYKRAVGYEEPK